MIGRPTFLMAVLVYLTLDLSLAAMPGAFVFEADESVESTQVARGRGSAKVAALSAPAADVSSRSPALTTVKVRPAFSGQPDHGRRAVRIRWSRAGHDPAPPSEDPH